MIAIIQRVEQAAVIVDEKIVGKCENGFMILLGVVEGDTEAEALQLAEKTSKLRVFCDENDKMNLSVCDVAGQALVVSNFTLAADTRKGNRPSFTGAAAPDIADRLYQYYCECLRKSGVSSVETGEFGADMKIQMTADGPITITLNTDTWKKPRNN